MKSWEAILSKCPYCDEDLNISSLTTRSERESIGNVIIMSKIHLNKCRGGDEKKLSNIKIRTASEESGTKSITWNYSKILS